MQKLREVEEAKALFNEGKEWSIWRWLLEKRSVRAKADAGTAAHDELEKKVKAVWSEPLRKAYKALEAGKNGNSLKGIDPKILAAVQKVKEADDEYSAANIDAEATFDLAEKRMSGGLAREAAQKAILAYELREKAIRRAEAAGKVK